jgi:hypothetical protein
MGLKLKHMQQETKNWLYRNWYKLLIIVILLWALGDNPYGYYQFLRWALLISGAYLAYKAYEPGKWIWFWIFGIIALLFNPIFPFYIDKEVWQMIDVIVAVVFLASIVFEFDDLKIEEDSN